MGRNPSLHEALAELSQCRTEDEIVGWAAKHRGRGSAEIYAAIRERFAALRRVPKDTEETGDQLEPRKRPHSEQD